MICNNQITKDEALEKIEGLPYKELDLEDDIEYVAKKFDLSVDEFKRILNKPARYYTDYPNAEKFLTSIYSFYNRNFNKN